MWQVHGAALMIRFKVQDDPSVYSSPEYTDEASLQADADAGKWITGQLFDGNQISVKGSTIIQTWDRS